MTKRVFYWLRKMWESPTDRSMPYAYQSTFVGNPDGQKVLTHMLDNIYCTVYEGTDPNAALIHNARRSVVHEVLQMIDIAEKPMKYVAPHVEVQNGLVR